MLYYCRKYCIIILVLAKGGCILEDLVLKIKEGDNLAFEKLCNLYQQKIYSLAFGLCGSREDALDITQDVLVKIYRGIASFKGDSSLSTWIYRVAKNTTYDFLRKNKKNIEEELPENFQDSSVSSPEDSVIKNEKIEFLRTLIEKIPIKYKTALLLREYQGLQYSEIAAILEISEGTVKSRIYRAREYLLKLIYENKEEL